MTFDDVRPRADAIVKATSSRHMPPWLPEASVPAFSDVRRLDDAQIETLRRWVDTGMARGSGRAVPASHPSETWQLGTPDLVVTLPTAYTLPPGGPDTFRNFVVPVPLTTTAYVRGVEFRPGEPKAVHHAVVGVDASGESRRLDAADPEPGYEGMLAEEFHSPQGHFVGWTPGRTPSLEPVDMAWRLEPNADLVVQVHLLPGRSPVSLRPAIGLYFSDRPPSRVPFMVKLTSTSIDIAPGITDYAVGDTYVLPVDVEALSIYPHAHYLARDIVASATLPGGELRQLLHIARWDFRWQEFYRYARPIPLPRGTRLSMRITYDNSASGVRRHGAEAGPPVRVTYGPRSSDEMADVWLQVLPARPADLDLLARDFVARRVDAQVRAAEQEVTRAPADAAAHNRLGARYLAARRDQDAVRAFAQALQIDADHVEAANNLGATLVGLGRAREALPYLERAGRRRPADARVQFNLGNALRESARPADAMRAFGRALTLDPRSAEAHNNLGVLVAASNDYRRALTHFEQAVASRDVYPEAHHNLGLALASLGRTREALEHVRRALELRPEYDEALSTLRALERASAPR